MDHKMEYERQPRDSPNTEQKAYGGIQGAKKPYNFLN